MRIISERAIRNFALVHPEAAASLEGWRRTVRSANWTCPGDVKASIASSDQVGDRTVFNIAGNRFRLIAFISFTNRIVYVKEILSHKEYDKGAWRK